jgi:hypothetical protein
MININDLWVVKKRGAAAEILLAFLDYDEAVQEAMELNELEYSRMEKNDNFPQDYLHIVIPYTENLDAFIEAEKSLSFDEGRGDEAESYNNGYDQGFSDGVSEEHIKSEEYYNQGYDAGVSDTLKKQKFM